MGFFFFDIEDPYVVITADIVNSRKIEDRYGAQIMIERVLDFVNSYYASEIASEFKVILGDEFQGALYSGANVLKIITEIELMIDPIKLRFGIGVGSISTEIDHENPFLSDGSAYHDARRSIDRLRENEKKKKSVYTNIMLTSDSGTNQALVEMLNTILSLSCTIKKSWTEKQKRLIFETFFCGENQVVIAEHLGITQPTVQRGLANANFFAYKMAIDQVELALRDICRGENY